MPLSWPAGVAVNIRVLETPLAIVDLSDQASVHSCFRPSGSRIATGPLLQRDCVALLCGWALFYFIFIFPALDTLLVKSSAS